jgi:cysteinyl-tRNA synthetase
MDNDFNTAQALGHLFEAAKIVNKVIGNFGDKQHPAELELLTATGRCISELGAIAGILRENPEEFLTRQKEEILATIDIEPALIEQLISQRNDARAAKDWTMSDQIRDRLLGHGIELKDGPAGTSWDVKRD